MSTLGLVGYHGPVTASLDWCEANYQFNYYIAEMANTFSNLFTIFLALFGVYSAWRENLPGRYMVGFIGVAIVGIGSFAFHATLLFEAQLADELPMIYVGTMSLWLLFDRMPGFSLQSTRSRYQLVILALFNILFTWSYYLSRNPVYHQLVFGALVFGTAFRVTYLLKWSDVRARVPDKQRSEIGRLFAKGAGLFALGFLVWNLDNIFCDTLTRWKVSIGWPLAFLLEGHSWWHILTATGTFLMSVAIQRDTLCIKDDHRNFTLVDTYGFPHIKRVTKDMQ
ncbi:ceramidase [Mycena floridula]|nr:ceramidase [Mycena floridula]